MVQASGSSPSPGAELTAEELAREFGIEPRPAEMLLTGCASLGLLERDHHGYRNTPLSERFLVRHTPYYFGGRVTMFDRRLYPGWATPTEAIQTNRPTTWDPERERSLFELEAPAVLETFWEAMHSLSSFTARALGNAIELHSATRLLDVGGGSGAFAIELCRLYPSLWATVLDLPHAIDIAADKIAGAQLRDRIAVHGGDFFVDSLPPGHDVHLYSMIMHDWNEQRPGCASRRHSRSPSSTSTSAAGRCSASSTERPADDGGQAPPCAASCAGLPCRRQLGHANLGTTSIYLQGIDPEEIIATVHMRRAPTMSASAGLRL